MKAPEYNALVARRRECAICEGLVNPSTLAGGSYDSSEIGPWSRLHGDLDAKIMVVGQDWGDVRYFETNRGLDALNNPTMKSLEKLLKSAGVDATLSTYDHGQTGLFLTNAVLCLKSGGLQASVNAAWFANCATHFLRKQVEIVQPIVVVPLGERAYRALCVAFSLLPRPFRDAVENPNGFELFPGTTMVPVYHCGNRILNTHRKMPEQIEDWSRIRKALGQSA